MSVDFTEALDAKYMYTCSRGTYLGNGVAVTLKVLSGDKGVEGWGGLDMAIFERYRHVKR